MLSHNIDDVGRHHGLVWQAITGIASRRKKRGTIKTALQAPRSQSDSIHILLDD